MPLCEVEETDFDTVETAGQQTGVNRINNTAIHQAENKSQYLTRPENCLMNISWLLMAILYRFHN